MASMEIVPFLKSVVDNDTDAVVVCDLSHTMIYLNPAAVKRYEKRGGAALVGKSVLDCHNGHSRRMIERVIEWYQKDASHNVVFLGFQEKRGEDLYMIALRDENGGLIGYYEKHACRVRDEAPPYDLFD